MSTISASTTSTTAYKVTADTTGTLVLQTGATPTTAVTIGTDQSVTTAGTINGLTVGKGAGAVSTNTAVGASALATNSTGANTVAIGYRAANASTGSAVTAVGADALRLTTADRNTAVGRSALEVDTTGSYGTAIGFSSLSANTTGSYNTAVGDSALQANTTGGYNVVVGWQAGYSNTTSNSNSFVGYQAGYSTTGAGNSFFGPGSGTSVTSGAKNTIIGGYSGNQGGLDIRTASNYIVLSDGDGNPRIYWDGASTYDCRLNSSSGSNYTQLSFQIAGSTKAALWWEASTSRFYTYTGTTLGPYISQNGTSWTNSSDERLKNITGEIQNGLSKVCTLRAAEYTWKADQEAKPQVGLIAQDVLAVLPQAVDVPPEDATDKDGNPSAMGVQYHAVIPLLVAAIKELKAEIDTLKGQA